MLYLNEVSVWCVQHRYDTDCMKVQLQSILNCIAKNDQSLTESQFSFISAILLIIADLLVFVSDH